MIKNIDSIAESGYGSWLMMDNKRPGTNPIAHNTGGLYEGEW